MAPVAEHTGAHAHRGRTGCLDVTSSSEPSAYRKIIEIGGIDHGDTSLPQQLACTPNVRWPGLSDIHDRREHRCFIHDLTATGIDINCRLHRGEPLSEQTRIPPGGPLLDRTPRQKAKAPTVNIGQLSLVDEVTERSHVASVA